jgi:hypothetical protein
VCIRRRKRIKHTLQEVYEEKAAFNPNIGELHIPSIDVPGAFGGMQTYEVYLKQQPLKFTFDLDMGRVVLK